MILDEAMNYNRNNGQDPSDDEEADPEDDDKPGGGRGAKRYVEKALNSGRASGEENTGSGIVALVSIHSTSSTAHINLMTFVSTGLHVRSGTHSTRLS